MKVFDEGYYSRHLAKVSRSFAFCIEQLQGDLRYWVGLSYLICRVLDTIEDSDWPDGDQQLKAFTLFDQFITQEKSLSFHAEWVALFPKHIKSSEAELIQESRKLFVDLHMLPNSLQEKIRPVVLSMSQGMRDFGQSKPLKIKSLFHLNWYCFFVAGVVGELLTDLVDAYSSDFNLSDDSYLNSYHFGLFLQKINLLKDQRKDEEEGRYFIHDRLEVLSSLKQHFEAANKYILEIPLSLKSYRLFCSWSLALGVCSLPYIEKSYIQKINIKISRFETKVLMLMVESLVQSPATLHEFLNRLFKVNGVYDNSNVSFQSSAPMGMSQLYVGNNFSNEIQGQLGLISQ